MGLDMYAYKMKKVTLPEGQIKFTRAEIDTLFDNCLTVSADEIDEPMYVELKPYLTAVTITNQYINLAQIKTDNGIDESACICMEGYGPEGITYGFRVPNQEESVKVEISRKELENKYVFDRDDEEYICEIEEVNYWRKEYDTQDLIHELITSNIENCGYYLMSPEIAAEVNFRFEEETGQHIPEEEDIFYHEWY